VSNAPGEPVSFSRPKVGYFSNRPRISKMRMMFMSIWPSVFSLSQELYGFAEISTENESTCGCCLLPSVTSSFVSCDPRSVLRRGWVLVSCCSGTRSSFCLWSLVDPP